MNKLIWRRFQRSLFVILAFILGCTITLGLMPLDRTCSSDKKFDIMKNSKLHSSDLIILIFSAPSNYEKRKVLRETWLKLKPKTKQSFQILHYFVIGNQELPPKIKEVLKVEQIMYDDVLILPMIDSYKYLTDKFKYSAEWLDSQFDNRINFKYVLKCDDDSFINLKELIVDLMYLEKLYVNISRPLDLIMTEKHKFITTDYQSSSILDKNMNIYWGYFSGNARIKSKGKWKETQWIAADRYLPYALGGGYLLSRGLISYIAKNAKDLMSFNSEDVSVGTWLIPVNNILRIHDIRFDTEWTSRGCKNIHLVTHNISPKEMKKLYENLRKSGKMCSAEITYRNHYLYNWNVPPSQCCKFAEETIISPNKT